MMYKTVWFVERNERGSIYFKKNKISCIKIYPGPAKTEENRERRKRDGKKDRGMDGKRETEKKSGTHSFRL